MDQVTSLRVSQSEVHVGRGWKRFAWLPLGTLIANMLACGTGAVIYAVMQMYVRNNVWSSVCNATITGVHGSLSTASTWAAEVRMLPLEPSQWPTDIFHSYRFKFSRNHDMYCV